MLWAREWKLAELLWLGLGGWVAPSCYRWDFEGLCFKTALSKRNTRFEAASVSFLMSGKVARFTLLTSISGDCSSLSAVLTKAIPFSIAGLLIDWYCFKGASISLFNVWVPANAPEPTGLRRSCCLNCWRSIGKVPLEGELAGVGLSLARLLMLLKLVTYI